MIQGLTEFLPVSSSGHLVFFQSFLGLKESPLFFDVMLHVSTLLAVLLFFRKDVLKVLRGGIAIVKRREGYQEEKLLLFWIVLACLPTGLIGLLFRDWFEMLFSKPKMVGIMFFITGVGLWLIRWSTQKGRALNEMGWRDAFLIGVAQGMAIIPGISRSGATISTALLRGLDRELSGRFSFLISVPAILGAMCLEWKKIGSSPEWPIILIGMGAALGTGLLSLTFLMKVIRIGKISHFSYYCFGMGGLTLFLTL